MAGRSRALHSAPEEMSPRNVGKNSMATHNFTTAIRNGTQGFLHHTDKLLPLKLKEGEFLLFKGLYLLCEPETRVRITLLSNCHIPFNRRKWHTLQVSLTVFGW